MLFLSVLYFHSVSEFEGTIHPANIRFGEDVLKTSWRYLKWYLQNVFKTKKQDVFLKTSWKRCLANPFWGRFRKTPCKHVMKTSWICLEDVLEDERLLRLRRLQDVLENKKSLWAASTWLEKVFWALITLHHQMFCLKWNLHLLT